MEKNEKQEILEAIGVLGKKVDGLEGKIDHLGVKVDNLEVKVDHLEVRFDGLETKVNSLETKVDVLETRFDSLETKVETLHNEAMEAIHLLSSSTDERFDAVENTLETLGDKIDRFRAEMPTKDYIDRKFADYDREAIERSSRMFVHR